MTTEREANIYEAKLAEQAERYDEMVAAIKKVAASLKTGEGLSVEERNIFSVAYKNVIGSRRATWRIVSSILKKEEDRPEKIEMRIKHARALANKVEGEMNSICNDCLKVIDDHLLPSAASDAESKTFYYKMYVFPNLPHPLLVKISLHALRSSLILRSFNSLMICTQRGCHAILIILLLFVS
jgi:14-3-3 protein epsilon